MDSRDVVSQVGILLDLVPGKPELTESVIATFEKDREGIVVMIAAASLMRGVPPQLVELIPGMGEVWSAKTLCTY